MYDFDAQKDYYAILGISEDATQDEVKKAFRKLAVKYHPDKAGGDKAKFQEANEAHQTLSDEKKRQQYDMVRKWWFGGMWGGWFDFGGGGGFDMWWVDLGDIMWGIFGWGFGGGRKSQGAVSWESIKHKLNITFEEAFLWAEKKISYTRYQTVDGADKSQCRQCNGRGSVVQQVQTPFGVMQNQKVCPHCQWTWSIFKKDGKELPNWWLEQHTEVISVKIPTWIKDWVYIKYAGKWHDGPWGSASGDLYIQINVASSKQYSRKWSDLYVSAKITLFDLVLGGQTEIPHPEWKLKVKIPKWTQIWDLIKITGKWFDTSWVFSKKWNLYIDPQIHIPKRLSKKQEKLRKELQKES